MHNYGNNNVSKCVNIVSKGINIVCVNVTLRNYRFMQPWSRELLTSPLGEPSCGNLCLNAKNGLEFFSEIVLKNLEFRNFKVYESCEKRPAGDVTPAANVISVRPSPRSFIGLGPGDNPRWYVTK